MFSPFCWNGQSFHKEWLCISSNDFSSHFWLQIGEAAAVTFASFVVSPCRSELLPLLFRLLSLATCLFLNLGFLFNLPFRDRFRFLGCWWRDSLFDAVSYFLNHHWRCWNFATHVFPIFVKVASPFTKNHGATGWERTPISFSKNFEHNAFHCVVNCFFNSYMGSACL